ncbi:MAG: sialidase family protein [Verrucomicrobiota bacterium]
MKFSIIYSLLFVSIFLSNATAADSLVSEKEVIGQVFSQAKHYFAEFQHPQTGVLYGSRLSSKDSWTSPADVLAEKPKPWGYGSRIADTGLHTGHILAALLDAYEARPDPFLKKEIGKCFAALKLIGSLPETHPKPDKAAQEGLVPRGPHPDDMSAWFDDSSMDQHTTYIISLALYANSSLASDEEKAWIKQSLGKVGRRLEGNDWSIKRADGVTESHVGFSWRGYNSNHVSILLPAVLALYYGTGDEHWLQQYEFFLKEADGKRWQAVHPGPHIKINGHPIYANQNAFRVNAWYHFEKDGQRKKVIGGLLQQSTEMQLARDFPGPMYRKFQAAEIWQRVKKNFAWGGEELHGAASAWEKFKPEMLEGKDGGMGALAHVRFPLGGYHMVLQSEQDALIRENLPAIWKMLTTVDLDKIAAAETHYLFTVVGLHLYALYFDQPELFESLSAAKSNAEAVHNQAKTRLEQKALANDHSVVWKTADPKNEIGYCPALARLPGGRLIACMLKAGAKTGKKRPWTVKVHTSDDGGSTWKHRQDVSMIDCFPFVAGSSLYVIGGRHDLTIIKSEDQGNTWSQPVKLSKGKLWYSHPGSAVYNNGRIYFVMDQITEAIDSGFPTHVFAPVVLSASLEDDLTKSAAWTFSNALGFQQVIKQEGDPNLLGIPFYKAGQHGPGRHMSPLGWGETNLIQIKDPNHQWYDPTGRTFHLLSRAVSGRTNIACLAKAVEASDSKKITVSLQKAPSGQTMLFVPLPGGQVSFHIVYDEKTRLYWMISSQATDSMRRVDKLQKKRYGMPSQERNRLALHFSKNAMDWVFAGLVAAVDDLGQSHHGGNMLIDGDDLVILMRTADADAVNAHNSNLITFHRVNDFRSLLY